MLLRSIRGDNMKNQSLLFSTAVLAGVNVLIRILGFGYRIVLVRLIGAEGLGLFELISPITMLIFTLVGSGVPIAVIRLTTQSIANNKRDQSFKILEYTSFIMIFVSLILSISLFISAPLIANNILKDERLVTPLYILAPAILLPSLAAILRGYFYGTKNITPPALSQLIEQIVRMMVVLTLLSILYPFSEDKAISISMVGVVSGELMGLFLLYFFFNRTKRKFLMENKINKLSFLKTIGKFSSIALPITFSRVISSLLRVVNSIIVPGRLMRSGLDNTAALSKFGQVNGMAMPLLFLPFTLTSALVMNLIPRISEAVEKKNMPVLHHYVDKTFHIAFFIGLPLSGMFFIYSNEIFSILYGDPNGIFLTQLSFATLFLCIYQISTSILQGIGKQIISTITYIVGMLIQLIITYILVSLPRYQINGYILSFLISFFFISLFNFILVFHFTKMKINLKKWIIVPSLSSIGALIISKYSFNYLILNFNNIIAFFTAIFILAIVYLLSLFFTGNLQSIYKNRKL
jgi:stage V sporulation protein B